MPRGGYRDNAGRKGIWNNVETKTIRVPQVLAERLLEIARILDSGGSIDIDTESKRETIEIVSESNRNNDSVIKSSNSVTKSNSSVTESNEVCPNCGFDSWKVGGYRTLKSGERKQKRQCKNCDRIWSVAIEQS